MKNAPSSLSHPHNRAHANSAMPPPPPFCEASSFEAAVRRGKNFGPLLLLALPPVHGKRLKISSTANDGNLTANAILQHSDKTHTVRQSYSKTKSNYKTIFYIPKGLRCNCHVILSVWRPCVVIYPSINLDFEQKLQLVARKNNMLVRTDFILTYWFIGKNMLLSV